MLKFISKVLFGCIILLVIYIILALLTKKIYIAELLAIIISYVVVAFGIELADRAYSLSKTLSDRRKRALFFCLGSFMIVSVLIGICEYLRPSFIAQNISFPVVLLSFFILIGIFILPGIAIVCGAIKRN